MPKLQTRIPQCLHAVILYKSTRGFAKDFFYKSLKNTRIEPNDSTRPIRFVDKWLFSDAPFQFSENALCSWSDDG